MTISPMAFELPNLDGDPIRGDVCSAADDPVGGGGGGGGGDGGAAIVVCHGFKGFKDWGFFPYVSEQLAEQTGHPVISFNFSGSGIGPDMEHFSELGKFEKNTFSKELDDLGVVLKAAAKGHLPKLESLERFGLLGHSRGGGITILRAREDKRVRALVTWSAISHVQRWSEDQKAEWRTRGKLEILNARTGQMMPLGVGLLVDTEANAQRLNIQNAASRLAIPYLIVHGTDDESVAIAEGRALSETAPLETTRFEKIEGAGHTFGAVHPFIGTNEHLTRAIELTARWFTEKLSE